MATQLTEVLVAIVVAFQYLIITLYSLRTMVLNLRGETPSGHTCQKDANIYITIHSSSKVIAMK